jgi:hypothetical protein
MTIHVAPDGTVTTIYSEAIDLSSLGALHIRRASHVEPTADGQWTADMGPVGGPVLGPFVKRSEALAAEVAWLEAKIANS